MSDLTQHLSIVASALSADAREAARLGREIGFSGILFDAVTPRLDLTALSQTGRREFRHVLSSNNLGLVGLRFDAGARGFGPGGNVERALSELDRVMETAAGLQAKLVCVDAGPLPPAPPDVKPASAKITAEMAGAILLPDMSAAAAPPPPRELSAADRAFADQLDVVLAELCSRADRYGVTVALRSELSSFASLDAALARARCRWLGVDLDPVAALRDSWHLDEIFSRLGGLVRHVRVRDAMLGDQGRTQPAVVGKGSVDWGAVLNALDAAGFNGWLTVDPTELSNRAAAARSALAYLARVRA